MFKIKYRTNKFLAWCGVWDAKHYIDKIENPELSEKEKVFVSVFMTSLSDPDYKLYIVNEKGLKFYETHNLRDKTIIKVAKDFQFGKIMVYKTQNNTPIFNETFVSRSTADRLINRFISEMETRSKVLKDYYEKELLNVLK